MSEKIAIHPSIVILKLMDIGEFLRGAGHDRFTGEDPMSFIYDVVDLIEAGALMRDSATTNIEAWDEALEVTEEIGDTP